MLCPVLRHRPWWLLALFVALAMGGAAPAFAASPAGYLDEASSSQVGGWARDPDFPNPIAVHVYIDGKIAHGLLADGLRPDLPLPLGGFALVPGLDEEFSAFLFPGRYDDVVAGRAARSDRGLWVRRPGWRGGSDLAAAHGPGPRLRLRCTAAPESLGGQIARWMNFRTSALLSGVSANRAAVRS